MRKLSLLFILIFMLFSCSIEIGIGDTGPNPFRSEAEVDLREVWEIGSRRDDGVLETKMTGRKGYEGGLIRFPLITDVHMGRDNTERFDDEFISFLKNNDFPFLVCLGDLLDEGSFSSDVISFIAEAGNEVNGNFIYTLGNHELHGETRSSFDRLLSLRHEVSGNARMVKYTYGPLLSIYKLDNASRTFGRDQLLHLEKALKEDSNPVKILIAHEIVSAGGVPDQSLILFGMPAKERNRLYRIMHENGVSLIFTGHHHKGNIIYAMDGFSEFNAAALHRYHGLTGDMESEGFWYVVNIDGTGTEKCSITVERYRAEDYTSGSGSPDKIYSF